MAGLLHVKRAGPPTELVAGPLGWRSRAECPGLCVPERQLKWASELWVGACRRNISREMCRTANRDSCWLRPGAGLALVAGISRVKRPGVPAEMCAEMLGWRLMPEYLARNVLDCQPIFLRRPLPGARARQDVLRTLPTRGSCEPAAVSLPLKATLLAGIPLLIMAAIGIALLAQDMPADGRATLALGVIIEAVAGAAVIYQIDRWSLRKRPLVHFAIMLVTVLPALLLSGGSAWRACGATSRSSAHSWVPVLSCGPSSTSSLRSSFVVRRPHRRTVSRYSLARIVPRAGHDEVEFVVMV